MKKVVSLLVALATAIGVSATAFAAVDDISGVDGANMLISPRVNFGTSGDEITLAMNELVIVDNATDELVMPEAHLEPGTEYIFKIYYSTGTYASAPASSVTLKQLTEAELGGAKLRLRGQKGTSNISSAKIEKRGSGPSATYRLTINTKDGWGTKLNDVEYSISTTGTATATTAVALTEGNMTFKVGYADIGDNEVDGYGEGDTITISNDAPVILKKQFETIAKANNYKAVQFEAEDGSWSYLGRVSGMGDTNFRYSRDVIPAIVNKFEDQDFEFLTFGSGVNFPSNGEMRIDVSDFSDDFGKMYTYLYRNGKLTPISTTYDTGADELVFRTNYLGSFVITDEQITDTTIIDMGNEESEAEEEGNNGSGSGSGNNENPDTGAGRNVAAVAALGIASLATATVIRKKK